MQVIIATTAKSGVFYRAGRQWTKAGIAVSETDFTAEDMKLLAAEPYLHIRPATEDEIAAAAQTATAPDEDAVIDALMAAIPTLADDAFGKTGTPDLKALRAATDLDPKRITAALRDEALKRLVEGGFHPPLNGAG